MKRVLGLAMGGLMAFYAGTVLLAGSPAIDMTKPPTTDEIAKLEPERCEPASLNFRSVTAALPFLAGSATRDMRTEQIALIDQYKESNRRKVWVLRVPAAFISYRTCDAGRQNWTGEGDSLSVGQHYQLSLLVMPDRVLPLTHASDDEKKSGVQVIVDLRNRVRNPDLLHRIYEKGSTVVGQIGVAGGPRCRDVPSQIPGLVTFKRIDPNMPHPNDCEGGHANGVYANKIGHLVYDFVVTCEVNCRVRRDFQGWDVEYAYHHTKLAAWQRVHGQLDDLLKRHTAHLEQDSGNP